MSRIDTALRRAIHEHTSGLPYPEDREPQPFDAFAVESSALPTTKQLQPTPAPPPGDEDRWWEPISVAARRRLVITPDAPVAVVEEFRNIAAKLHQEQADRGLRIVLVASAAPAEGKTLAAVNLALTLSESFNRRVLLVDADVRRPTLHDVIRIPNNRGLVDVLQGDAGSSEAVRLTSRLSVLPAGTNLRNPVGLLSSNQMRDFLSSAAAHYDWVILDSAPINLVSDGRLLARLVDGVLLVVRAGRTGPAVATRTIELIGRSRIVGVIFNCAPDRHGADDDYYTY